jgi:hypothetical protein
MKPRGIDLLAAASALVTLGVLVLYLAIIASQGGVVAGWVVVVLAVVGAATAYASRTSAPGRRAVLWPCGVVLLLLGLAALLSIGLLVMVAGGLCLAAAVRGRRPAPAGPVT